MSNTKWRRVFNAIADSGITLLRSEWKHIDSDYITMHVRMPHHNDVSETRFNDGPFQPYEYKWIEWIRFPFSYYDAFHQITRNQDLRLLETTLAMCGAVRVVTTEDYIALIAYDTPSS